MDTVLNPINVPGWDQLLAGHPTKARVLQALTNLELAYFLGDQPARPTRKAVLLETNRLIETYGPATAVLAGTSDQTIQRHLDDLAELGHVIKLQRGKSSWTSRYLILDAPVHGKVAPHKAPEPEITEPVLDLALFIETPVEEAVAGDASKSPEGDPEPETLASPVPDEVDHVSAKSIRSRNKNESKKRSHKKTKWPAEAIVKDELESDLK